MSAQNRNPEEEQKKKQDHETGTPSGAGFTGGTQEKTREADESAKERSDSGEGL